MKKYLKYLAVPLLFLVIVGLQLAATLVRGPLPAIRIEAAARSMEPSLLDLLSRRAGVGVFMESVSPFPQGDEESADLLVFDEPLVPRFAGASTTAQAPAGPFDPGLDGLRDRTVRGLSTVVGFGCLSGTENQRMAGELAGWTGMAAAAWTGSFVDDLSSADVSAEARAAWSAAEGRPWDFSGPGLVLRSVDGARTVVLRRGIELDDTFFTITGELSGIRVRSLMAARFAIPASGASGSTGSTGGATVLLTGTLGLKPAGASLVELHGIPQSFPLLTERRYGTGRVWALAADLFGSSMVRPGFSLFPLPRLDAWRTLDEPSDANARMARVTVPVWRHFSLATLADTSGRAVQGASMSAPMGIASFRSGKRFLEKRESDGSWQPWFVKGVNLGPATPGHWFGDPPVDEGRYRGWFDGMAAAGFDAVRVYTLLPPAFYRAFAAWNAAAARPLYLIQEIWPEEEVPQGDLGDPDYLATYFGESDRTIDALFGRADIAERSYRAWGHYRADVSPWLAAVLVGRELLPEEALATVAARPWERFQGEWFTVAPGHPVESVLASMAERAAGRIAELGGPQVPVGFVSWPTLDPMHHPAEWKVGSQVAPYHDRAAVDFTAIERGSRNETGFFAAFHIYPNYPDFMFRSERYEAAASGGADALARGTKRYGAYIEELADALKGVPLLVAEFGLATGYGTAHIHPEGLDHGGLPEAEQADGLVGLYRAIASSGATGGVVFQWADEWAKKTWTTETYMIPFDRNPLWHNAIDPEQNYGVMAWAPATAPVVSSDGGIRAWGDESFLHLLVAAPEAGDGVDTVLTVGLDVVPGQTGEYRLAPGGPLAPQGSEFVIRARLSGGRPVEASLLAQADYNRGGGRLFPRRSDLGGFTRILTLVNAAVSNAEGRAFPSVWEDGSVMPIGPDGLVETRPDGGVLFHLPWSRLNFSDPSERRVLLDPVRDSRSVLAHDVFKTVVVDDVGIWAVVADASGTPLSYLPEAGRSFRMALRGWEDVSAEIRPKAAFAALAGFLPIWFPLR